MKKYNDDGSICIDSGFLKEVVIHNMDEMINCKSADELLHLERCLVANMWSFIHMCYSDNFEE